METWGVQRRIRPRIRRKGQVMEDIDVGKKNREKMPGHDKNGDILHTAQIHRPSYTA